MKTDTIVAILETATHENTPDKEALAAARKLGFLLKKEGSNVHSLLNSGPALPARQPRVTFSAREQERTELRAKVTQLETDLKTVQRDLERYKARAEQAETALQDERGRKNVKGELNWLEFAARVQKRLGTTAQWKQLFWDQTGIELSKYIDKIVPASVVDKIESLKPCPKGQATTRIKLAKNNRDRDQQICDRYAELFVAGQKVGPIYQQIADEITAKNGFLIREGAVKVVISKAKRGKIKATLPKHLMD